MSQSPAHATTAPAGFAVLVPIKPPALGKSRIIGVADSLRESLARAFAFDTVSAALSAAWCHEVLAITDDVLFADQLREIGAAVIPDGMAGDMNGTLVQGAHEAARRWPDLVPVALVADLPALRPVDLDLALQQAAGTVGQRACFVTDQRGVGTTLFAARLAEFTPAFGVDSASEHTYQGALALGEPLPSLRHDVDDIADLQAVLRLGVGPATARAVSGWGDHANGPTAGAMGPSV